MSNYTKPQLINGTWHVELGITKVTNTHLSTTTTKPKTKP